MKETLIEFPCDFPIKIIGVYSDSFLSEIKAIVIQHFPDFKDQHLSNKMSGKNNYLAITAVVNALNQPMLDAFYQAITQHPAVKMVL